jgi:hypothetical protein
VWGFASNTKCGMKCSYCGLCIHLENNCYSELKDEKSQTANMNFLKGENTIKGVGDTKIKVLFQGVHMTHVIYVLVYNL